MHAMGSWEGEVMALEGPVKHVRLSRLPVKTAR